MKEPIKVFAIDCGRHDYWKVSIETLIDLNIVEAISGYSYIGNGDTPLNEKGYAYLEIDSDVGVFDKAAEFYNQTVEIDMETLTEAFYETYDDYRDWHDDLTEWDTDVLDDQGYMWDTIPENLIDALQPKHCDECGELESECMCEEDEEE